MAPDQSKLLSAYVDGELSPRQREAVERLLEQSPPARRHLKKLRQDAAQIRALPPKQLDAKFALIVLEKIAEQQPVRKVYLADRPAHHGTSIWVGFATAGAVLLVVGAGSYWFFNETVEPSPAQSHYVSNNPKRQQSGNDFPEEAADKALDNKHLTKKDKTTPQNDSKEPFGRDIQGPPAANSDNVVSTMSPGDTRLASPVPEMEMFQPKVPDISLGAILSLHQLDLPQLKNQLKAGQTVRLELPCRETSKAFAKVEASLRAANTNLLTDQNAQVRLKLPKLKTNYVFYVEDLTQDELIKLLSHLSVEDRRPDGKQKIDVLFDKLLVDPMSEAHHKQLSQLLGVDPRTIPAIKSKTSLGVDPKKPLSEGTSKEVVQNLTGQGGTPRPDPSRPVAKPGEHQALALAYNPVRPHASSPEVKRFLESRKPARAGTIQVLLVLRGT